MSRFQVTRTPLAGLAVVRREPRGDSRGSLCRLFCSEELAGAGWSGPVAQINQTITRESGVVRGMHYQVPPMAEYKLVMCLRGSVFDVAVDLRAGSPTFLHWHAEELSADNLRALLIPAGFAHGFQTLSREVELLYCHSAPYSSAHEAGVSATDPRLAIEWPLPIAARSPRDLDHAPISDQFKGVAV